jgi:hypothetical protein
MNDTNENEDASTLDIIKLIVGIIVTCVVAGNALVYSAIVSHYFALKFAAYLGVPL